MEKKENEKQDKNMNENETFNKGEALEEKINNEDTKSEDLEEDVEAKNVSIEETLQEEIVQLRDEKLRLLAEMENLRKRSDRDRIDSIRYGSINLARDILSPDDNLTRALDAIPEEEEKSETILNLIDGLKMVQKEFATILEKYGVKRINALNKRFDHNFHEAMLEIESTKIEEGLVIQEIQSGYTMYDRLLRPSMVGVSKKPTKDKKDRKKD